MDRQMARTRRSQTTISIAVIVLVAAGLAVLVAANLSARSPDVAKIDGVIDGAIRASQALPLEASAPDARPSKFRDENEAFIKAASDELSDYYTGDVLARKVAQVRTAVDGRQSNTDQSDDTGVDNVTISDLVIKGDRATATAVSHDWADYVQPNPDGSPFHFHPAGTTEYAFSLERSDDGDWLIDGESWDFGPGSEP